MEKESIKTKVYRTTLWPTAAILLLIGAYALSGNHFNVMMNSIIDAFQLVGAEQGMLSSMLNIGGMFALLLTPLLQGRISKLQMLMISAVMQAMMLFAAGITPNFGSMAIIYIVLGIGGGWIDTYGNSLMVDLHSKDSAKYLGLLHGCYSIGGVITPILIHWLLMYNTWRRTYIYCAVIVAVFVILSIGAMLKSHNPFTKQSISAEKKVSIVLVRQYLQKKRNILLIVSSMLNAAAQTGLIIWIVRYMTLQFDAESFGSFTVSVFWICATISRFIAPRIRVRPLKIYAFGALLAGLFNMIGVLSGSSIILCIMIGAIGLVSGHSIPILISEGAVGYKDSTSLPTSILLFSMCLARVVMPLIMGAMVEHASILGAMMLPVGMSLLAFATGYWTLKVKSASL